MMPPKLTMIQHALELFGVPLALGVAGWAILGDRLSAGMVAGGVILGVVFGYAAWTVTGGGFWTIVASIIGVFSGPGIVMFLAGKQAAAAIARALLGRAGVDLPEEPKGDGDQP